ncbi:hypothetical protein C8R43DRAFT_1011477 [Mycena crocata]|nr:hypothetical protein C8R43DRAFT_1011477 [Mycena crocata]
MSCPFSRAEAISHSAAYPARANSAPFHRVLVHPRRSPYPTLPTRDSSPAAFHAPTRHVTERRRPSIRFGCLSITTVLRALRPTPRPAGSEANSTWKRSELDLGARGANRVLGALSSHPPSVQVASRPPRPCSCTAPFLRPHRSRRPFRFRLLRASRKFLRPHNVNRAHSSAIAYRLRLMLVRTRSTVGVGSGFDVLHVHCPARRRLFLFERVLLHSIGFDAHSI